MSKWKITIRAKILFVLFLISLVLGLTTYFTHQYILLPKFVDLEHKHIRSDINRVSQAIENELQHLDTIVNDWSSWDDSYKYAVDYNVEFEISNLTIATLINNQIHVFLILDNNGMKLWGNTVDENFETSIVIKPFDQRTLSKNAPILQNYSRDIPIRSQSTTGLVHTSAGLMLCVARPILDSYENGPPRGTIIMGRFLRDGLIDKISRLTDVSFDVKNLFKHSLNTDYGSMLLLESPPNTIFQPDGDKITATKVYKDISGVPMMELSVTENREILLHGYEALRVAQLYTIGGVMASLLLMMLMLHRSLVRPLLDITHKISSSQGPGQSWTKLDMGSCASYEMCVLADEFNNLMEALDAKNTKIIETNHKLRDEASKLAEAEKNLRNLDNLKSEFISTAAHELRTPVATIMGYTELLSDESLNQSFSEEQKKDFRKEIMDNSERLSMIIDDILDLSRIEHGQSILLDKTYASLEEILKKSSRLLAIKSEAVISINISPEVPKEIEIDAHRISQVVDNLLSNAIKYSPERRNIFVNVELEGEHCKVAIIDQGIGMNEEQRTQIFDKFYRADATNTAVRGLGLGMSIVKRIINEHGGTIWVESAIGQGTKVHFTLPLGARGKVVSVNLK